MKQLFIIFLLMSSFVSQGYTQEFQLPTSNMTNKNSGTNDENNITFTNIKQLLNLIEISIRGFHSIKITQGNYYQAKNIGNFLSNNDNNDLPTSNTWAILSFSYNAFEVFDHLLEITNINLSHLIEEQFQSTNILLSELYQIVNSCFWFLYKFAALYIDVQDLILVSHEDANLKKIRHAFTTLVSLINLIDILNNHYSHIPAKNEL